MNVLRICTTQKKYEHAFAWNTVLNYEMIITIFILYYFGFISKYTSINQDMKSQENGYENAESNENKAVKILSIVHRNRHRCMVCCAGRHTREREESEIQCAMAAIASMRKRHADSGR